MCSAVVSTRTGDWDADWATADRSTRLTGCAIGAPRASLKGLQPSNELVLIVAVIERRFELVELLLHTSKVGRSHARLR